MRVVSVPRGERAREVDGVVAAQAELLSELSGMPCEGRVDPHDHEFFVRGLEVLERTAVCAGRQTADASRGGERRPTLGVGQDTRCRRMSRFPKLGRELRALFGHDELHER